MSTSSEGGFEAEGMHRVQRFQYPVIQPAGFRSLDNLIPVAAEQGQRVRDQAQAEMVATIEASHSQGLQQGRAEAAGSVSRAIEQERAAISAALGEFAAQRSEYFRRVEAEAVRLALSIARKVLHREAQMDPLLLAGVVRVALDQMQAGSRIVLRTSQDSATAWQEFWRDHGPAGLSVEVVSDDSLPSHSCVLQAEVGTTEISLDHQLKEIEGGFFDLLRESGQ